MLDLETLSTRSNAVILTLAAIKFDRNQPKQKLDQSPSFYRKINIESCNKAGLHTDEKTVKWWSEQDEKTRKEALEPGTDRIELKQALQEFFTWIGPVDKYRTIVWSQGTDFDMPILSEACRACGLIVPWPFWQVRDTRTLYDVAGLRINELPQAEKHNALYDCWRQIWGVKESLSRLSSSFSAQRENKKQ